MLVTKLVVRLLGENEEMLGWAEEQAEARGDGCLTVVKPTVIPIDVAGVVSYVSVHWCDVNVEIRSKCDPWYVKIGETVTLPENRVAMRCGEAAGGLPPVTVRESVMINMLPGGLGVRAN